MELVKAWQEKTNEPKTVPATLKYKDIIYLYSASIYISVGNKDIKDCLKGVRVDIYRAAKKEVKTAAVYSLLGKIKGYVMRENDERLFDLDDTGLFSKVDRFSCFDYWTTEKFLDLAK